MKRIKLVFVISLIAVMALFNACTEEPTPTTPTTVTDIDGNVYHTVVIGTQTWMVENLTTTRYRDGSSIPNVSDAASWPGQSEGAYCDYDNAPVNSTVYGKLYNWYAVIDSRNIAPLGWHVPDDGEWRTLTDYLGGESVAGGKLKETGYTHWANPNTDANNESGFTALPGGCRGSGGAFFYNGSYGYWWSTTEDFTVYAYFRNVGFDLSSVFRNFNQKAGGFSIRCIKD